MPFTKMPLGLASLCMAICLAASTTASADGITTTFSGYGTVGSSFTSNRNYSYHHDSTEYIGSSDDFDIGLDSRIGLQAVVDFGSKFSVTVQEVARERRDKYIEPDTEWFYAQYTPDSDWTLRLGRVALGTFLLSDSRLVGYADAWFHAPNEVYASEPFQYVDGAQVLWHKRLGEFGVTLQSSYGTSAADEKALGVTLHTTADNVFNASASLEFGSFLLRAAQTQLVYPNVVPVSADYSLNFNSHDKLTSLGFQYDNGSALMLSEWTNRAESLVPIVNLPILRGQAWYVAGGWRFGKLTPLLMLANSKPDQSLATPAGSFTSESATLRYDVAHNVALKAEVTRAAAGNFWYWTTSVPAEKGYVEVFALGADFVF